MMNTIAIIVSIIVGLLSWISERNLYNPGTIMGFLWALICSLASMRLYFLYEASEFTYILITLAIASFGIGCFVSRYRKVKITRGNIPRILNKSEESTFSYGILSFLCVFSVIMMLDNAMDNARALMSGIEMSDIRARETATSYGHPILYVFNNYIVRPFSFAILPIYAVDFFVSKKGNKIIGICTILIILERVLIEGGRIIIIYVLSALLVSMAVTKNERRKVEWKKLLFFGALILVAAVAIYNITISRGIEAEDQGASLYKYICGCVPHLSIRLKGIEELETYTWGFASLNGIVHYVAALFENIGLEYPEFLSEVRQLINVENKVSIASRSGWFNAFVTPIYYMYLDGRVGGVIIGMFLYGFFSYNCYAKLKNHVYPRDLAVYILIIQGLMTTMVRIQFSQVYYTVAFFFICFLINRKEVPEDRAEIPVTQSTGQQKE